MSTLGLAPAGVLAPTDAPPVRGVVRVRQRALDKVVREASATAIGVARGEVDVEVLEWSGGLNLRVSAKLPIPALDDTEAIRALPPVLDRVRQLQSTLAEQVSRLTGRQVGRVSFTVTGAVVPQRRRVA